MLSILCWAFSWWMLLVFRIALVVMHNELCGAHDNWRMRAVVRWTVHAMERYYRKWVSRLLVEIHIYLVRLCRSRASMLLRVDLFDPTSSSRRHYQTGWNLNHYYYYYPRAYWSSIHCYPMGRYCLIRDCSMGRWNLNHCCCPRAYWRSIHCCSMDRWSLNHDCSMDC